MNSYKTIWISDIHLGTSFCKADALCNFLKNNHCETLFLVGDIVDGWKLKRKWDWPQEHNNIIRKLITKAKRGTKIVYVPGNHDEFIRPWITNKFFLGNIEFAQNAEYIDVLGRKWLVTHGDQFDQVVRNWKFVSLLGDFAYETLLKCNSVLHKIRSIFGLGYWSFSKFVKEKTKQAINFIYKFETNLTAHAKRKGYHGVICGHIHTPAIKQIDGTVYMNDGDWVETCSAIAETFYGEFQLLLLTENGEMRVLDSYK